MNGPERAPSLENMVFLHLVRAQEQLMFELAGLLKERYLSPPQYNALRILRGAGNGGLSCQAVSERMLTHLPDVTRLLDRLAARGLITRERGDGADRRRVINRITEAGGELLVSLDDPVASLHAGQFAGFSQEELLALRTLLARLHP